MDENFFVHLKSYQSIVDQIKDMKEDEYLVVECAEKDAQFYQVLGKDLNDDGVERMRLFVSNDISEPKFTIKQWIPL